MCQQWTCVAELANGGTHVRDRSMIKVVVSQHKIHGSVESLAHGPKMRGERGRYGDISGEKDRGWVMRHDCGKECFACVSMQRVQMNIGYPHGSHNDIRSIIQSSVATL